MLYAHYVLVIILVVLFYLFVFAIHVFKCLYGSILM